MDYTKFKVEDFAADDLFVKWVLDKDPGAERFWTSYISNHPEVAPVVDQARILLLNLQRARQPTHDEGQINRVWQSIERGIEEDVESGPRFSFYSVAAAISVIALVSLAIWFRLSRVASPDNTVSENAFASTEFIRQFNDSGKTIWIHLSDGTEVALENQSELAYKDSYLGDSVRRVYLNGEAFFRVAKNQQQPFLVYSNEVVTKVLGTAFRVKAFNDQKEVLVTVAEGKVSVYSRKEPIAGTSISAETEMKGVVLTSNQEVQYSRSEDAFNRSLVDAPKIINDYTQQDDFQFQSSSITEVFKTLEEAYGVEIIYHEEIMKNCFLTVSLRDEPLYEKLKIICRTLGATYELIDAKIVINSKGC